MQNSPERLCRADLSCKKLKPVVLARDKMMKNIKRRLSVSGLMLIALAYCYPGFIHSNSVSMVKDIDGYQAWQRVNARPIRIADKTAMLCRAILPADNSPHRDKYINVFVNDIGREAMLFSKSPKFSRGTVIVKEKLTTPDSEKPELLTVMIKRDKGFDAKYGDWEYLVISGTGTAIEAKGKLENCQSCHIAKRDTDYIFRNNYISDEFARQLK
jgi:hypothetical protein